MSGQKKTVRISDIQKPSKDLYRETLQAYGMMGLELYPLFFEEQNNMLDKNGRIEHDEVFKAVCNGFDIDYIKGGGQES